MFKQSKSDFDIYGPLKQAERCLNTWLSQEKRAMTEKQKQRATALIARYFHHEDELTDELIMSFLNHYSGKTMVDLEDPTSVRMEIKAVLDLSQMEEEKMSRVRKFSGLIIGILIVFAAAGVWEVSHKTITKEQQAELKELVHQIAELDRASSPAAIWNAVKEPMGVSSYQKIKWWRYTQARGLLEEKLSILQQKPAPSLLVGTRM